MPQEAIAPATSAPAPDQISEQSAEVSAPVTEQVAAPASTEKGQTQSSEPSSHPEEDQFQLEGIDPKTLTPEFQKIYKNMESGWTKLSQKKSEKIRAEFSWFWDLLIIGDRLSIKKYDPFVPMHYVLL